MSFFKKKKTEQSQFYATVSDGLKKIYTSKLLPLEECYDFHEFVSPALNEPDFDAKPMILLVGQYSTGKTTFIRYLLEKDYPGIRIGPEPTTDCFTAVMYGEQEQVIPGNALAVDNKRQFRPLAKFGGAFLNRFQCSTVSSPVLKCVTMIDTPGILSGEKQRVDRGYDFVGVLQWFAERVDRIILLFDANKLDISDEFRRSIEAIHGYEDKVRIVLNKADQVDHHELMRVYGALMWSISKVISVPECPKVFVGSYWDQQLKHDLYRKLFEKELQLLFDDLQDLPKNAAVRKINDFIKRARMAKIHAYIISSLKADMPCLIGKSRKKKELIRNLPTMFKRVQEEHMVSASDVPPINAMQEKLALCDFSKFPPLKERLINAVDVMLDKDIASLVAIVPTGTDSEAPISGGAFDDVKDQVSPFGFQRCEGVDLGSGEPEWIVTKERSKWDAIFRQLGPINGKITGSVAKKEMIKSRLTNPVLAKIWRLADVDKDGLLDADEFALAMHLIHIKLDGFDLPEDLPEHLVPPSKKYRESNNVFNGRRKSSGISDKSGATGGEERPSARTKDDEGNKKQDTKAFYENEKDVAAPKPKFENEKDRATESKPAIKTGSSLSGAVKVLPGAFVYEDTAHQRQKFHAKQEEEARLADEITKGLESVTLLTSQHMSEKGITLARGETLSDETDAEDASGRNGNSKVHTLTYRSSVLESSPTGSVESPFEETSQNKVVTHKSNGGQTRNSSDEKKNREMQVKSDAESKIAQAMAPGEHTYANLGVTFTELTEKMKTVVSEMSSSFSEEEGEAENERASPPESSRIVAEPRSINSMRAQLDGDGLPYIDDDSGGGSNDHSAALDDAIAVAAGLDRAEVVSRVELASSPPPPPSAPSPVMATSPADLLEDRRPTEGSDTMVQADSAGRVVVIRRETADL